MVRESGGQRPPRLLEPPTTLLLSNVCSGTGQALVFGTEIMNSQEIYKKNYQRLCLFFKDFNLKILFY